MNVDITTIGVGFETSGLEKGTAALDKAGAAADRMAERVGKLTPQAANAGAGMRGLGQATTSNTAVTETAIRKADEYIKSLQKQLDLYGKSEREIRRYSAAAMGMTDAQRKQTDALLRQNEALERGDSIGRTLKTGILALGAATVAAGAAAMVMAKNMIDSADAMNDMSQRTGIAVKDLAMYEMAAKQSGTTMDAISIGVKGLSSVMVKHSEDLKAAGITATDADGAMRQLADIFAQMPDGIEKTNLAVKIFGRSGMELIPMLNMGSAGLAEAAEKSAKYAEQMAIMAPLADKYNDNMTEIALSSKAVGMTMLNDALPGILAVTRAMADATQKGGIFAGVMAGLGAGMDNYWKGVGNFYGKTPSAGGASGSWSDDGRKGLNDPRIVTPRPQAKTVDDKTAALIKALSGGSGGKSGGGGGTQKVSDYDRAIKSANDYIAKLKEEAVETGATAEQVKMLRIAREAAKAPTAELKMLIMTQALANEQARDAIAIEKELAKSKLDTINAQADAIEKIQDSTQSIQEQIQAERDHIAEMGLSKDALNALEISRINDNAASLDRMATIREEVSPAIAEAYRQQADALRGLATAKGEAAAKASSLDGLSDYDKMAKSLGDMANSAGKMGDGFKKATTALSGFSNAFKTLSNAEKNTKADTIERTQAQVGGYAEMAGAAKQFFDEGTAGYEALTVVEQAFRALEMASSVAAMVQKATETTSGIAQNVAGTGPALAKGAAEMFAQSGWGGFVGVAAMMAVMAGMAFGGGGGGPVGTAGAGNQIGSDGRKATNQGEDMNAGSNYNNATGRYDLQNKPQLTDQEVIDRANAAEIDAAANAVANLRIEAMKLTKGSEELELSLARARLAAGGLGKAQHELATQGMNEAELASYNYNQALMGQISVQMDIANGTNLTSDNMKELAAESRSLAIELMMASGDIAGARAMQRDDDTIGYTAQEVAMYDHNQAMRDQRDAMQAGASAAREAAAAEQELAQTRYDVAGRLNILLGRQTQLQFDRATELAAATDATVISMLNEIYKIEDLTAARDASFAVLERSIAKEKEIATLRLKGATDLASALKTTLAAVSQPLDRQNAQSQIAMYAALAKAGGVLPSAAALKPALDAVAKPSMDLFKTFSEYAIDQARTANDIADLSGYADKQVSIEQKTIEALDLQLETAKNQLDAMNGVNTSVMGVADAVRGFEASMIAIANAKAGAQAYSFAAPAASSGGGGGGGWGGGGGGGAAGIDPAIAGMNPDIVAAYKAYYGRNPDQSGHDAFAASKLVGDDLSKAILHASIADPNGADYAYALSHGYDPSNPNANYLRLGKKASSGGAAIIDGSFATGSNFIPRDMVAQIHQGEEITPRPYVDMQRASREESNALMARLVASNERLEAKVAELNAAAISNANHNSKTASLLDDVINGGRSISTTSEATA